MSKNLNKLKRLTKELAEEVHYAEEGPIFKLVTLLLDNVTTFAVIVDNDKNLIWANKASINNASTAGINIESYYGQDCSKIHLCNGECDKCPVTKAVTSKKVHTTFFECVVSHDIYDMICIPLIYDGVSGVIVMMGEKHGE